MRHCLSRFVVACSLWLVAPVSVLANPAEDGDVVVASGNVVLNAYSTLSSAVSANATDITVASAVALALPACPGSATCNSATGGNGFGTALGVGDLLMIYQPQELGGAIDTSNGVAFGAVTDAGQAGLYEFVYVQSVSTNTITIVNNGNGDPCTGLKNDYDSGAMVIRVPQLRNLTIDGGSVTAPAWNGSTGGVVALDVRPGAPQGSPAPPLGTWVASHGTVAINAANGINVSGLGFRGGAVDNIANSSGVETSTYRSGLCGDGGRKGESILGWAGDNNTNCNAVTSANNATGSYVGTGAGTADGHAFGRGAIANGGGGGNAHNAGGGGGSNGGVFADWTGAGNPRAGFDAAWNRDDNTEDADDLPTVTATSTSSGGGRGGYTYSNADQDALAVPPGCTTYNAGCGGNDWGGNDRRNRGGLGGRPLDRGSDRFFFGGGGGAGDANNAAGSGGGRGGGLVFLIAQRVSTTQAASTVLVRADGAAGGNTVPSHNDAPGGGGGGGTIVVTVSETLQGTHRAAGGAGGNQLITGTEAEGPGGGGGGGVIAASWGSGTPTLEVPGAQGGTTSSTALTEFTANGATGGGTGTITSAPSAGNAVFQCMIGDGGPFTTPAGHAHFHAQRASAGSLRVEFSSTYELGNVAYFIEGERAGRIERISDAIARIPGEAETPRSYALELPDRGWERFWVVEVDAHGGERRRGPFALNQLDGARPAGLDYDWSTALAEQAALAGVRPEGGAAAAYLEVSARGMQRVTYEQLSSAGIDLAGVPVEQLALSDRSGPVGRNISGGPVFGPGSAVEFFGDPQPDLYKSTHTYLFEQTLDANRVKPLPVFVRSQVQGAVMAQASPAKAESAHVPANYLYDPVSPTDSPWYMYEVFANAGSPASTNMAIAAPNLAGTEGVLFVELSGFINQPPGALPDHSVRVYLNNVLVASDRFDGIVRRQLEIPVSNVQANNVVRVELPGDTGYSFDMVGIHDVRLRYGTLAQAIGGRFTGFGVQSVGERSDRFFTDRFGDAALVFEDDPIPSEQQIVIAGRSPSSRIFVAGVRSVIELVADPAHALNGSYAYSPNSRFWVGETSQMALPQVSAAPALQQLPQSATDWMAISHGLFMAQAEQLAAHRRGQGLTASVVAVEQLYRRYTAGNAHPSAIERFLEEHAEAMGLEYLVLVGSANYNSVGLRGTNVSTLSHVPTRYVRTNRYARFAPSDTPYGDLTGDGLLEVQVGRLPVRTAAEATEAVRKLIAYESQAATEKALLSSGAFDNNYAFSFMQAVDQFQSTLPPAWDVGRVDVEAVGTGPARTALIDAINQGRSVITYTGHSSPVNWDAAGGGQALFSVSDVASLPVNNNQPVFLQFGCWTTYFVSPVINAMGNALVLTPNRGGSAVFGSTVLLDQGNHDRVAAAIGPRLLSGQRLGDVIQATLQQLGATEDPLQGAEVRLGITLLGDPAAVLR